MESASARTGEGRTERQHARELNQENLQKNTQAFFDNLAKYLKGELTATSEEYKLLEQMNVISKDKYAGMTHNAADLVKSMEELQRKYAGFQPYLAQIDEIDDSVAELESTVKLLDDYTAKLEARFEELYQEKMKLRQEEQRLVRAAQQAQPASGMNFASPKK